MNSNLSDSRKIKTIDDVLKYYPTLKTLQLPLEFQLNDDEKCFIDKETRIWKISKDSNGNTIKELI
jgi:hypothetical protein